MDRRTPARRSVLSQTNALSAGSAAFPRGIDLRLGQGRMTDDLRSLKPISRSQPPAKTVLKSSQ